MAYENNGNPKSKTQLNQSNLKEAQDDVADYLKDSGVPTPKTTFDQKQANITSNTMPSVPLYRT